jgi:peptidoglycan glycosyltransferase
VNRELKRVSGVVLLMFLALFVSTTAIQVFQADSLRQDDRNRRAVLESYSTERGQILVDGQAIAQSQPVTSTRRSPATSRSARAPRGSRTP